MANDKTASNEEYASVTIAFKGKGAADAAQFLYVQFLDGGLDEHIEGLFNDFSDFHAEDYTWENSSRLIVQGVKPK